MLNLFILVRGHGVISSTRTTSTVLDLLVIFIDTYSLIVCSHYKPVFSLFILRPYYNIGYLVPYETIPDYMGPILRCVVPYQTIWDQY